MTFPPPPPSTPPPPPAWAPSPGQPPPRRSSPLVPLLIVGAISVVMLMAGAAAAILIVLMNSGAFSPAPPMRDTPPVAQAPPPDVPPEAEATPPESDVADESTRRPSEREGAARAGAKLGSRVGGLAEAPPPPPPPMAIRVGGGIATPRKVRDVRPVYPQIAQRARVEGVVIIEATIDRRGKVSETRLLRSIPLLDQAALDAVRQWEYDPTLLNGVAVPVIVTVTVTFTLR